MDILDISEKPEANPGGGDNKTGGLVDDKTNDGGQDDKPAARQTIASPKPNTQEDVARQAGWKPESEWEGEDANKPNEFISAELFNERGKRIESNKAHQKRLKDATDDFDSRLNNMGKLHNVQMEAQKKDLQRKLDDAIKLADVDEAKAIQKDIDSLQAAPEESTPTGNPDQSALDDWNSKNSWIFNPGPKAAYAISQFNAYANQGLSVAQSIAALETDIAREYPAVNTNRNREASSEGGSPPGRKASSKSLTMADLTPEEAKWRKAMPGAWKDDKEYLQAVADARRAEQ